MSELVQITRAGLESFERQISKLTSERDGFLKANERNCRELREQITQLIKERDELKAEVLGFQVREIGIKGLTACAEKERDQLAAKCAEMRNAILKHKQFVDSVNPSPCKGDVELHAVLKN